MGFKTGKAAYEASHIPGAVYLDIKEDLTGKNNFLPEAEKLATKLGTLGVNHQMQIILYDQGNQRAVSKAWYVLHYLGHEDTFILQEGFPAWVKAQQPITTDIPKREETTYQINLKSSIIANIDDIKRKLQEKSANVIDSRSPERYRGEVEPKYKKAGHIPGAMNYHAKDVFDENGNWKTKDDLKENFSSLQEDEEMIILWGAGNSACMNVVALKEAGFANVKLFSGGFSEWIEDDDNKVAIGEEHAGNQK